MHRIHLRPEEPAGKLTESIMINIVEALKTLPTGRARFIAVSAAHIINAGIIANDSQAAAAEARRIFGRTNSAGMWKKMQADARRVIETCEREGLTLERPYKIERDACNKCALIWTVDGQGRLFPASWVGPRSRHA